MERRCHKCDRPVYTPNEHDGLDCENWPEMAIGQTSIAYKGFAVLRWNGAWAYIHQDDRITGDWIYVRDPAAAFTEIDLQRK